jgi:FkbM family methyltransferase
LTEINNILNLYEKKVKAKVSREKYWQALSSFLLDIKDLSELQEIFDNKIEIFGGQCILETRATKQFPSKIKMLIAPYDLRSAPFSILADGFYEPFQADLLVELGKFSKHFIDVGANMGFYCLALCAENDSLIVNAFEPQPNIHKMLKENLVLNEIGSPKKGGRVTTHNIGLGSIKGQLTMFIPKVTGSGGASFRDLHQDEGEPTELMVPVNLLDNLVETRVDLIKLDVEGSELNVIDGAEKIVNLAKPTIVAELLRKWMRPFGHSPQMFLEKLLGYGYECHAIGANSLKPIFVIDDSTVETNFIFVHPEKKSHNEILKKYAE